MIVATWKLDRRAEANGAKSEPDIKSVGSAEAELKTRVEETASSFRESTMRDPRRRQPHAGGVARRADAARRGRDDRRCLAMGKAVGSLNALKTKAAMPPELEALNHLLKAQAEVKERQISRQTGNGGHGANRRRRICRRSSTKSCRGISRPITRRRTAPSRRSELAGSSMLDKIRELAQRQDELLRRQQELARQREKLTPRS